MEALQQSLREHETRLEELRVKAEHLDDALAGGQNLRKVVGAARTIRQDLADVHANFQAPSPLCTFQPHACCLPASPSVPCCPPFF